MSAELADLVSGRGIVELNLSMGAGKCLAIGRKSQVINMTVRQKMVHALSRGGFPDDHALAGGGRGDGFAVRRVSRLMRGEAASKARRSQTGDGSLGQRVALAI